MYHKFHLVFFLGVSKFIDISLSAATCVPSCVLQTCQTLDFGKQFATHCQWSWTQWNISNFQLRKMYTIKSAGQPKRKTTKTANSQNLHKYTYSQKNTRICRTTFTDVQRFAFTFTCLVKVFFFLPHPLSLKMLRGQRHTLKLVMQMKRNGWWVID